MAVYLLFRMSVYAAVSVCAAIFFSDIISFTVNTFKSAVKIFTLIKYHTMKISD